MNRYWILAAAGATVLALSAGDALSRSDSLGQAGSEAASGGGEPTVVPLDSEANFGAVRVACTGIGQSKDDPRWKAYPMRIEFSNPAGDFLANGAIRIASAAGETLASVSCEGPWVLVRPTASARSGRGFRVTGWIPGQGYKPLTQAFTMPTSGQRIIDLRFAEP